MVHLDDGTCALRQKKVQAYHKTELSEMSSWRLEQNKPIQRLGDELIAEKNIFIQMK